jgi:hypothetical protein
VTLLSKNVHQTKFEALLDVFKFIATAWYSQDFAWKGPWSDSRHRCNLTTTSEIMTAMNMIPAT